MMRMAKRLLLVVAGFISLGFMNAFAKTITEAGNIWYGDELSINVTKGESGYMLMSAYASPRHAYEMSNHMVSADGLNHEIPQTLVLIDASKDYTWTPDGPYVPGDSNYEVLYCADACTGYNNGVSYKRMNLEDSVYYSEEKAARIRAIVTGSYPFVSLEKMKAGLAAAGFADAENLTRAEIITAVQSAIWYVANGMDYRYSRTFDVSSNSQWGGVMHDFTNEMDVWWTVGKRKFSTDETVGARINSLIDHLKVRDSVHTSELTQVVISDLSIVDSVPVQEKGGLYTVALQVSLNSSGSSARDKLFIKIYVGDVLEAVRAVSLGSTVYDMTVEAAAGQIIRAEVSGTQNLPKGVYLYEAQGGRDVSQSLVGVAMGETEVHAKAEVLFPEVLSAYSDLILRKTDRRGNVLSGAVFDLSVKGVNGDIHVASHAVDENGVLVLKSLLPGSYTLVETKASEGYRKLANPITFTVDENAVIVVDRHPFASMDKDGVLNVENCSSCVVVTNDVPDCRCLVYKFKATVYTPRGVVRKEAAASGSVCHAESSSGGTFVVRAKDKTKFGGWIYDCSTVCDTVAGGNIVVWDSRRKSQLNGAAIDSKFIHVIGKRQKYAEWRWDLASGAAMYDWGEAVYALKLAGFGSYSADKGFYTSFKGNFSGEVDAVTYVPKGRPGADGCVPAGYWLCTDLSTLSTGDAGVAYGSWTVKYSKSASKKYAKKGYLKVPKYVRITK